MFHPCTAVLALAAALLAPSGAVEPTGTVAPAGTVTDEAPVTWGVAPADANGPDGRSAFEYKLDPGATLTDWVAVSNHSQMALTLNVYAHDALTNTAGGFDLAPADAPTTGAGDWITLERHSLTIPPRTRVDVPFRLDVPDDATPGDHAAGVVASLTHADGDAPVQVDHRVGARVYLRVSGELAPRLEVERVDVTYAGTIHPFGTGQLAATYTVRNTGNVRLAGEAVLHAAGPFGLGGRTSPAAELPELLPGGSYTTTARLTHVAPLLRLRGEVEVRPVAADPQAAAATPAVARGHAHTWAPPYATTGLVLLAAAMVVAAVWARRRRAARFAAAIAAAHTAGAAEAAAESTRVAAGDAGATEREETP